MRVSILIITFFILLCLTTTTQLVNADQEEAGAGDVADEAQTEEEVDQQAAVDDAYAAQDAQEAEQDVNKFTVCSDAVIQVLDVQIYCDSPGTFYYGSGKYRNNPTCMPGDKGKVLVDFYIAQPEVIQKSGGYALVDIIASVSSGWYQESVALYDKADLCSASNLKSLSRKTTCPSEGKYRIKANFYWPEKENDYQQAFYPQIMVGFKSSANAYQYDYGGANTPYCRGSSFVTWTNGLRTVYANAISNFMKSFGILLITIIVMGAFIWFLVKKPKSVKDAGVKLGVVKQDIFSDEEFDFTNIQSPRNGQNLVDF